MQFKTGWYLKWWRLNYFLKLSCFFQVSLHVNVLCISFLSFLCSIRLRSIWNSINVFSLITWTLHIRIFFCIFINRLCLFWIDLLWNNLLLNIHICHLRVSTNILLLQINFHCNVILTETGMSGHLSLLDSVFIINIWNFIYNI